MKNEVILENNRVQLVPLKEHHIDNLWPIAKLVDIYEYGPNDISTKEKLSQYISSALKSKLENQAIPFAILDKKTSKIIGCTRFGQIDLNNKVLHIGWTWISPEAQGTGLNQQMKFLMLTYAFEILQMDKVEFRIDERNVKSRKAVEKLGATLEGILRKNVFVKNNFKRNTCCYGILEENWQEIKETIFKDYSTDFAGEAL